MNRILGYFTELFGLGLIKRTWHYSHDAPYCLHIIDLWNHLGVSPMGHAYCLTPSGRKSFTSNSILVSTRMRADPYLPRPLLLGGDVDSWDGISYGYPYTTKDSGAGIE